MRKTHKDDNALQRTERLTILLTKAEFAELRERAGIVSLSGWIRARLFATAATQERFREAEEAPMLVPGTREPGEYSYPPASNLPKEVGESIQSAASVLQVSGAQAEAYNEMAVKPQRLPRSTPVRRKHINVREDVDEEKPVEKVRCTYLWPSRSKKCPRCRKVHSDV